MIQLPNHITLTPRAFNYLNLWQNKINTEPTYETQIAKAKSSWGKSNQTFDEIKEKLRLMSNNTYRCHYCEDSYADEIEHIYPKDIFPEKTFIWENYLYACGPCNGPKNNKFALLTNGTVNDITPPQIKPDNYVYRRPPNDPIALIDPRVEDPFYYLELDIIETFRFVPHTDRNNPLDILKAEYTIEVLRLNAREYLIQARKHAFNNFKARLIAYFEQKRNGVSSAQLRQLIQGIQELNHQTVWHEMKRSHAYIPELNALFNHLPEAINW